MLRQFKGRGERTVRATSAVNKSRNRSDNPRDRRCDSPDGKNASLVRTHRMIAGYGGQPGSNCSAHRLSFLSQHPDPAASPPATAP